VDKHQRDELRRLHEAATNITGLEWLREGSCIYSLIHDGWKKGVEVFRNQLSFNVNIDRNQNDVEREVVAQYLADAHNALPALLAYIDRLEAEVAAVSQKWLNKESECNELLLIKAERDQLRAQLANSVSPLADLQATSTAQPALLAAEAVTEEDLNG
jgi:hypothetical protein